MNERTITIEKADMQHVSDGYHTFGELYDHRCTLFLALMRAHPEKAWRSRYHHDGSGYPGWFLAGMELPTGQISYHLPMEMWPFLDRSHIATYELAPKWDGHSSAQVIDRMKRWMADETGMTL